MEQNIVVEFLFAEWPSHVDVCKQDGRVGIDSYPVRQRQLMALDEVSASMRWRGGEQASECSRRRLTSSLATDACGPLNHRAFCDTYEIISTAMSDLNCNRVKVYYKLIYFTSVFSSSNTTH